MPVVGSGQGSVSIPGGVWVRVATFFSQPPWQFLAVWTDNGVGFHWEVNGSAPPFHVEGYAVGFVKVPLGWTGVWGEMRIKAVSNTRYRSSFQGP